MNQLSTTKQLIKWTMEQCNGYQPLPQSIHILLYKHGITPINKFYNNKPVKCYNTKNAQRIIAQHIDELQYWDEQNYFKLIKKESINKLIDNTINETINNYINNII